jgi:[acyl-carrier-protein] S-malonyltransferase
MLAMFPGQGSQFVGMGRELLEQFPKAKLAFEEAEDATHLSLRKLCLDGPDDELKLTANTQPCILTVSAAVWRVLQDETGLVPSLYAGHSLGEYSALVASGRLPLGRAAWLVRKRGEAMQEAVPAGLGAMAAVINAEVEGLNGRCKALSRGGKSVEVVNYNSPQQLVVAGHKTAVDELCAGLEKDGIRFVMLPVSAPFHSSLMKPAREAMEPLLRGTTFAPSTTRLIPNLTGKVTTEYGPELLVEQICSPVLWTQTLEACVAEGCEVYLEVGPGKVLFGLARRSLPKSAKLLHTEELVKAIESVKTLKLA